MYRIKRFTIHLVVLAAINLMLFNTAWSADEDMISQVYLEFDPETGEFKTALDPSAQVKNQHMQSQQVEQIQQAQDALAASQSGNAQSAAAAPAAQNTPSGSETGTGSGPGLMLAGIIALGLLVGIVVWVRKSQQTA